RSELERAHALDRDLTPFALDLRQRYEPGIQRERSDFMRTLEADEKLMSPRRGIAERQNDAALSLVARCEAASGHASHLVTRRQPELDRPRLALHDGDVDKRRYSHIRVVERDERHHVGEHPHFASRGHGSAVAHRPPDVGGCARTKGYVDDRSAVV